MNLPDNLTLQRGKYRIIRFISSGGFGCTYEAVHVLFHKRVAIKEFFVKDFCNRDKRSSYVTVVTKSKVKLVERLKKKFLEEAGAMNSMHHPNIVHVIDVFEENNTAYYVMDYIDGKSLQEIIKEKGVLKEKVALKYISQIAEALKYVHSLNRLHLDIKPGNIMINNNDDAILIDFGASKQYDEVDGENTSTLIGKTPGYAPLEQLGNEVSRFLPATDIYALGATLYKLVTGKTPINATLLASGETLVPIPQFISSSTRRAIYAAMEINKKKRPQSIEDFMTLVTTNGTKSNEHVHLHLMRRTKELITNFFNDHSDIFAYIGLIVFCTILVGVPPLLFGPDEYVKANEYYNKEDYTKAFELYTKAADDGSSLAQYKLGIMYYYGEGVSQDYAKAIEWFSKAAEQGDVSALALYMIGSCYYQDGAYQDYAKAIEWFSKAAEQGYSSAQYMIGICYFLGRGVSQDYAKAIEWFSKAAEQEYSSAQYMIGSCYYYGDGVSQDYAKAIEWFNKAAEQGSNTAQYMLGQCYYWGNGVPKDYAKAVEWYSKAAEQGYDLSQKCLGDCYYYGHGVSKDYSKAVEWYRKAANQGNKDAKYKLEGLGESLELKNSSGKSRLSEVDQKWW